MKTIKKLSKLAATGAVMTAMAVNFNACTNDSPFSPANEKQNLNFLDLGTKSMSLNKDGFSTTKFITQKDGGEIVLNHEGSGSDPLKMELKIKVDKQGVSQDADLMVTFDDLKYFVFTFTSLSSNVSMQKDSEMLIKVDNADLSGMTTEKIDIYFEDPETGSWSKLPRKETRVTNSYGKVEIIEIKLPGFGRFALYPPPSQDMLLETTGYVTYKDGGVLMIEYKGEEHNNGNVYVKSTFKVYQESISEDAELRLGMGEGLLNGDVDANFQPHGITFSGDAELTIEAKNIDLSGVDASTVGLYYVSDGQWEKMQAANITVNKGEGYLKIDKAKIPHFSRYAVAWSN